MSCKICAHAIETPTICHNYRIYHENRICVHASARVDVVQWLSAFLCYLYEIFTQFFALFTLFVQKNRTIIYGMCPTWG
jgi:hypothetical protein